MEKNGRKWGNTIVYECICCEYSVGQQRPLFHRHWRGIQWSNWCFFIGLYAIYADRQEVNMFPKWRVVCPLWRIKQEISCVFGWWGTLCLLSCCLCVSRIVAARPRHCEVAWVVMSGLAFLLKTCKHWKINPLSLKLLGITGNLDSS